MSNFMHSVKIVGAKRENGISSSHKTLKGDVKLKRLNAFKCEMRCCH